MRAARIFPVFLALLPGAQGVEPPLEKAPAFHRLIRALESKVRGDKYRSAEGLGVLGDLQAVPFLIGTLEDADPVLRSLAAASLFRITGRVWGEDAGAWKAWWAAHGENLLALRLRNGETAVAELAAPSFEIRFAAARTLERIGFREGIPALIEALGRDELTFRWRCARSLGALTGEDYALDQARWREWWSLASRTPVPEAPPVEMPPVPEPPLPPPAPPVVVVTPPARLLLDPHGAIEERARLLQEERDAMEARVLALEQERARQAADEVQTRKALEAELRASKEMEMESREAAEVRARQLQGHLEETRAAAIEEARVTEEALHKGEEALAAAERERDEARARAERTEEPLPPEALQDLQLTLARLKVEVEIERARSDAAAAEVKSLRERPGKPEPAAAPPVDPADPAAEELEAWRAGHRERWAQVQGYVIRREDSLSEIAKRFHTDVETLLHLNQDNRQAIRDKHRIYAGYRINVPAP